MLRKIGIGLAAVVLLAVVGALVLLFRTFGAPGYQPEPQPYDAIGVSQDAAVARLSESLQIPTVSSAVPALFRRDEIKVFHRFLEEQFPRVHETLKKEVVNEYSLLYTWEGRDPDRKPMLLLAHMDVVPVDNYQAQSWTQDPFGGDVADGYVWGRGALDDKGSLMAILEAVEGLIGEGFEPERTVMLCFGHDEEIGGPRGAKAIAALLMERGIRAEFSLDEGMGMMDGIVPGMPKPLAIVALAEKGFLTLELSVEHKGGHSSNPPEHSAIGILAEAVTRLENRQMPASLDSPFGVMFRHAGPEMSLPYRVVMANLDLFEPLLVRLLLQDPQTAAALRTTTAVTMFESGVAPNVLPNHARATVNHRVMPRNTIDEVIAHVRRVINDERVKIEVIRRTPPSPVSDHESPSYEALAKTIRQVFPDVAVAPGMDLGGSDSKHYTEVAEQLYRFWPFYFEDADTARLHGIDERISVENYVKAIQFYAQIIRNAA